MSEFEQVFQRLRQILMPYAKELELVTDDPAEFYLNTRFIMKNKKPMYFGSTKINKRYVSYHLMPVYVEPALLDDISPELKDKMQGKSCFNFKQMDEGLFEELARLTLRGLESYRSQGYLEG